MRSCVACMKAKTRCDTTRPSCARCVARHISCSYPSGMVEPKASSNASPHWANHLDDVETMDLTTAAWATPSWNETAEPMEATLDFPDFSFVSLGFGLPDWGLPERSDSGPTTKLGPSVPMLSRLGRRDRWRDQTIVADQTGGHPIPRMPTFYLRSFAQSKSVTGRSSATATLMTRMLTSYPRIMYRPGSLPPFIHPHSLGHNTHNPNESLTTCVTLTQMVSSGATGSRKLFWKNVRLECERLQVEVPFHQCLPLEVLTDHWQMLTFDKWGLLSAMQALTVYILVRLQEGETPDNNQDVLLLSTLWVGPRKTVHVDFDSLAVDRSLRPQRESQLRPLYRSLGAILRLRPLRMDLRRISKTVSRINLDPQRTLTSFAGSPSSFKSSRCCTPSILRRQV
jgi:hypothetical protein